MTSLPFAAPQKPIRILGCLLIPTGLQVWIVNDASDAQALAATLGGKNLIFTQQNLEVLWAQTQTRIKVQRLVS